MYYVQLNFSTIPSVIPELHKAREAVNFLICHPR